MGCAEAATGAGPGLTNYYLAKIEELEYVVACASPLSVRATPRARDARGVTRSPGASRCHSVCALAAAAERTHAQVAPEGGAVTPCPCLCVPGPRGARTQALGRRAAPSGSTARPGPPRHAVLRDARGTSGGGALQRRARAPQEASGARAGLSAPTAPPHGAHAGRCSPSWRRTHACALGGSRRARGQTRARRAARAGGRGAVQCADLRTRTLERSRTCRSLHPC